MSRSINSRGSGPRFRSRQVLCTATLLFAGFTSASFGTTVDSATIVPGSYTQGTVNGIPIPPITTPSSLDTPGYQDTGINLAAWNLSTGGNFAINFNNPQFQAHDIIAFGNGGGLTLQLNAPITPVAGQKTLGIFTAQAISGSPQVFINKNMDAAILVSSDGVTWYNLKGALIASPNTYTSVSYPLNAPTMAYDYGTNATALSAGKGQLSANQLAALPVANYLTPMPNDSLFNGSGAPASFNQSDSFASAYANTFGTSGGGNWFDVSGSGLTSIDYVRLNGDANDPSNGGVRLTNVFATPEPGSAALLCLGVLPLLARRKANAR